MSDWIDDPPERRGGLTLAVYDDFTRADTTEPDLGTAPIGGTWLIGGIGARVPGTRGCIRNGAITTTVVGSAGTFFAITPYGAGAPPRRMWAKVKWKASGGTGGEGTFAMGCGLSLDPYIVYNCLHLRLTRTAVFIERIRNDTYTSYVNAAISPALSMDTVHLLDARIDPETGLVQLYVNGVKKVEYQSNLLKEVMGEFAFWECVYGAADSTAEVVCDEVAYLTDACFRNVQPESKTPRFVV